MRPRTLEERIKRALGKKELTEAQLRDKLNEDVPELAETLDEMLGETLTARYRNQNTQLFWAVKR